VLVEGRARSPSSRAKLGSHCKAGEFAMIYIKSALAGLLAVAAGAVALPMLVIVGIVIYSAIHSSQEGSVGWDPISLIHPSWPILTLIVVCFTAGFFWEFRRLTHQ
jgi:hypothetical protein